MTVSVAHGEFGFGEEVSPAYKLTELYRQFYRGGKKYNPSTNKATKPIYIATNILVRTYPPEIGEETILNIAANIEKLMQQVHKGTAGGAWILSGAEERQAIYDFSSYFVNDFFKGKFKGQMARFAGKQQAILEDTCEFLYRIMQDFDNALEKALQKAEVKDISAPFKNEVVRLKPISECLGNLVVYPQKNDPVCNPESAIGFAKKDDEILYSIYKAS